MNSGKAQSIVTASAVVTFGMMFYNSAKDGNIMPPAKSLIGGSVVFLLLEFLADVEGDLAAAFGFAIATTALFHYGPSVFAYINKNANAQTSTPPQAKPSVAAPKHVAPHR